MLKHECEVKMCDVFPSQVPLDRTDDRTELKKYLRTIILKDLADIIFSYTNLLLCWNYYETHMPPESFSCVASGVINNEIICLYEQPCINGHMYQLSSGQICIDLDLPEQFIIDGPCIYIVFGYYIRVTNIHEQQIGDISTKSILPDGSSHLTRSELRTSFRYVKNDTFYISTNAYRYTTNTKIINTIEPSKWYVIKNIRLFENKYTKQLSADHGDSFSDDYFEHPVIGIMVNRVDDIIVLFNTSNNWTCTKCTTIENEGIKITCMPIDIKTTLLYFDDNDIIVRQSNNLVRRGRSNGQYVIYGYGMNKSEKIFIDSNFVCICRNGRVDVYKF